MTAPGHFPVSFFFALGEGWGWRSVFQQLGMDAFLLDGFPQVKAGRRRELSPPPAGQPGLQGSEATNNGPGAARSFVKGSASPPSE